MVPYSKTIHSQPCLLKITFGEKVRIPVLGAVKAVKVPHGSSTLRG